VKIEERQIPMNFRDNLGASKKTSFGFGHRVCRYFCKAFRSSESKQSIPSSHRQVTTRWNGMRRKGTVVGGAFPLHQKETTYAWKEDYPKSKSTWQASIILVKKSNGDGWFQIRGNDRSFVWLLEDTHCREKSRKNNMFWRTIACPSSWSSHLAWSPQFARFKAPWNIY
jgi:ssDNA-binding Zn-finger/Zn-ribbon topoisomerase 1